MKKVFLILGLALSLCAAKAQSSQPYQSPGKSVIKSIDSIYVNVLGSYCGFNAVVFRSASTIYDSTIVINATLVNVKNKVSLSFSPDTLYNVSTGSVYYLIAQKHGLHLKN